MIFESGQPKLDVGCEKNINIAEKIYRLYHDTTASIIYPEATIYYTEGIIPEKFAADEFMLMFGLLYYSDYLRDMKSDYGILPTPKYDESQEDYLTLVLDVAGLLIRDLMSTGQSNLATLWAAKESSANAKLDALIEAYTKLE